MLINYVDADHQMPPAGKLPQAQLDILSRWVRLGAPWTAADADFLPKSSDPEGPLITDESRNWWAYRPLTRPAVPQFEDSWIRNPIDAFILAQLRDEQLRPAAPVSP